MLRHDGQSTETSLFACLSRPARGVCVSCVPGSGRPPRGKGSKAMFGRGSAADPTRLSSPLLLVPPIRCPSDEKMMKCMPPQTGCLMGFDQGETTGRTVDPPRNEMPRRRPSGFDTHWLSRLRYLHVGLSGVPVGVGRGPSVLRCPSPRGDLVGPVCSQLARKTAVPAAGFSILGRARRPRSHFRNLAEADGASWDAA